MIDINVFHLFSLMAGAFTCGYFVCLIHRNKIESGLFSQIMQLKLHIKSLQTWIDDKNNH